MQLFRTLALSILLYNAETWLLAENEKKMLEAKYYSLARTAMGEGDEPWYLRDGKREARIEFFAKRHMYPVPDLIAK